MVKEFSQMLSQEVFDFRFLNELSEEQRNKIIHSSMFSKEKYDEHGNMIDIKSRWVGSGNEQDKSLYEPGSSPTVAHEAVMIQLGEAAAYCMEIEYGDVGDAFLEATMTEEVYV